VGVLAEKHQIAAKHLMTAAKLLPVLRNKIQNTQDLIQQGILGVEAAGMIGTELIAMVQGKRAMRVRGNEVEIIHTEC
jgi:hypothetical protein